MPTPLWLLGHLIRAPFEENQCENPHSFARKTHGRLSCGAAFHQFCGRCGSMAFFLKGGSAMDHGRGLYLEDLHVGQRFTSDIYQMDQERVMSFAAEFDPQPFHLDLAEAQASIFGGLAAS